MAEGVQKVNDDDFEAEIGKHEGVAVVDFSASWCPPCKMLAPILTEVATEAGDRAKVVALDVDESRNTAAHFNVLNVPTIVFFKNGKEVERLVGVAPKEKILQHIDKIAK